MAYDDDDGEERWTEDTWTYYTQSIEEQLLVEYAEKIYNHRARERVQQKTKYGMGMVRWGRMRRRTGERMWGSTAPLLLHDIKK